MFCDKCGRKTKVMQTAGVYRRRKCLTCNTITVTMEYEVRLLKGEPSPFAQKLDDQQKDNREVSET